MSARAARPSRAMLRQSPVRPPPRGRGAEREQVAGAIAGPPVRPSGRCWRRGASSRCPRRHAQPAGRRPSRSRPPAAQGQGLADVVGGDDPRPSRSAQVRATLMTRFQPRPLRPWSSCPARAPGRRRVGDGGVAELEIAHRRVDASAPSRAALRLAGVDDAGGDRCRVLAPVARQRCRPGCSTASTRSIRSASAPLRRGGRRGSARRCRCIAVADSPWPHGHGLAAAKSWNSAGNVSALRAREIVTPRPRAAGAAPRGWSAENSPSSSRKSTPRWASVISPGRGGRAAADQPGGRDRVMRGPERAAGESPVGRRAAGDARDLASPRRLAARRAAAGSRAVAARPATSRRPEGRRRAPPWPPAAATSRPRRSPGWPFKVGEVAELGRAGRCGRLRRAAVSSPGRAPEIGERRRGGDVTPSTRLASPALAAGTAMPLPACRADLLGHGERAAAADRIDAVEGELAGQPPVRQAPGHRELVGGARGSPRRSPGRIRARPCAGPPARGWR